MWQAEKMVSQSREVEASRGGKAVIPKQPSISSSLSPCWACVKIKNYLSPVLGFNFPSVSLKVPLTGYPRKVGILQGEFLCTKHQPAADQHVPPAQGSRPSSCSPFQLGWGPLASSLSLLLWLRAKGSGSLLNPSC